MNYRIDEIKFKEFILNLEDVVNYAISKKDFELDGKIQNMILALENVHNSVDKYSCVKDWQEYWVQRSFDFIKNNLNVHTFKLGNIKVKEYKKNENNSVE